MNEKFYNLSAERQLATINAGFEVFGKFDYKKASTQLIAQKAGVSKSLLFHYFKNKEAFFKFLYLHAENLMRTQVESSSYKKTDDFFKALEIVTEIKCSLLKENAYILQFLVTARCSKDEVVQKVIESTSDKLSGNNIQSIMNNIDFTRFNDDVVPSEIIEMLAFTLDGYLQNKLRHNEPIILEDVMNKYKIWTNILKKSSYK